ncbi:hypothetical protein [Polyangium aurulentum]|uniref:hypothetical protein n=1 Tax=Polyangium aurulentum TaxID=2567896 RepID=UPI0010AE111C|nr:hypothetical protein [Polyangium aurulentum]UQA61181.1 hypothetical protein E8A73_012160 [Polyangium aurulentum]
MIEGLIQQFLSSGAGKQAVEHVAGQGLGQAQAEAAVQATAEGAAEAVTSGGGGGGGLAGLLGGGGGLGALAGALGGVGGGGSLPPGVVDGIAKAVAGKAGIDENMARTVVNAVLPRVMEFVKSKMGGGGDQGGGGKGILGGLLG